MSRLTPHTAAAFGKLRLPDFEPVRAYLSALRTETLESMVVVSDEYAWRRLQGRAQVLQELLDLVESSGEIVARMSRPRPAP